jgi:hypothetical protein
MLEPRSLLGSASEFLTTERVNDFETGVVRV